MIRVLMCGPQADSGGVANHTKSLIKEFSSLEVSLIFYNFSKGNSSNLNWGYAKKTYRRTIGLLFEAILRKDKYDLIHVQTSGGLSSFLSSITGSFASKIVNKKLVITFHHSNTEEFVDKYKHIFKFVLRFSDRMILVSEKQKKYISNVFPEYSSKLVVIPNGYDADFYYPRDIDDCRIKLDLPHDKKIIYNISNLIEVKGHKYLIKAMKSIVQERNDVLCVIVGKGYLVDQLESQIEVEGLQDYVKLVGWKPDDEVPIFMNACDFFVHASLKEGNPTVMFECLGCGKPYVGTRVGGVPEIITHKDYGLLVEPGNPQDLAEKIMDALNKNWNKTKIISYSAQFTWENISRQTLDVYNKIS
ncbi:glycosyltransferase family 4 protein [Methanosarcina mazei]|uniref:Glycosyl transferase family 1 n=2 Tax=Methanosarcina TaxID=2207 RepID=A0A0F8PI68_METMZ|nr:glycosyltransferase family 4 protein [Methanosarcina mazei]KKH29916.1 hypothetical protein DU58_07510 [Methanosarcina mazei]